MAPGHGLEPARGPLEWLDDACVLRIMRMLDPAPDLYNLASTCKRFRALANDERLQLTVHAAAEDFGEELGEELGDGLDRSTGGTSSSSSSMAPQSLCMSGHARLRRTCFASLEEALAFLRPGDRLLLEPGWHRAAHVVMRLKVLISGKGKDRGDVKLAAPASSHFRRRRCARPAAAGGSQPQRGQHDQQRGNAQASKKQKRSEWERGRGRDGSNRRGAVLEFARGGRVSNVSVLADLGPTILHSGGDLVLSNSSLICSYHPLEHLNIPIVTTASGAGGGGASPAPGAGEEGEAAPVAPMAAGALRVQSCEISGPGSRAVAVEREGGGEGRQLRDVRTLFLPSGRLLFWFDCL